MEHRNLYICMYLFVSLAKIYKPKGEELSELEVQVNDQLLALENNTDVLASLRAELKNIRFLAAKEIEVKTVIDIYIFTFSSVWFND